MSHSSDIRLYGFSMALNIDCLHNLGTLFFVKHLLNISSSQLCKVGPRLFSCFTSTLSMPAAFLFLGAAIPFLYSSSEKMYTSVTSPAASVCSIRMLRFARHGALTVEMVGLLERFLNDSFPLLATVMCQISRCNDFFPSLILLFHHSLN